MLRYWWTFDKSPLNISVNVYEDYLQVFGDPPPPVASLFIMSDSDNTGESATTYLNFSEVRAAGQEGGDRPRF
jgi:hypothetical protein